MIEELEHLNLLEDLHTCFDLRQFNFINVRNKASLILLHENCLAYYVEILTKAELLQVIIYEQTTRPCNYFDTWYNRFKERFEQLEIEVKEKRDSLILPNKSQVSFKTYHGDSFFGLVGSSPDAIFMPYLITSNINEKALKQQIHVSLTRKKGQLIAIKDLGYCQKNKSDTVIEVTI